MKRHKIGTIQESVNNEPNKDSPGNKTKKLVVYSFWIVLFLLFLNSYSHLLIENDNNQGKEVHNGNEIQHNEEVVNPNEEITKIYLSIPDTLEAHQGIDITLKDVFLVGNDKNILHNLVISTQHSWLRLLQSATTTTHSIQLVGTIDQINQQIGLITFRGVANDILSVILNEDDSINVIINVHPIKLILEREVSLLIKTHERPKSLDLLVESIRSFYPNIPVLIGDDSKNPQYTTSHNVLYYPLQYDYGLSASRNFLVSKTTTPYFMTLDDDFVFTNATLIEKLFQLMKNHDHVDLVSGSLYTDTNSEIYDYSGKISIEGEDFKLLRGDYGYLFDIEYQNCRKVDIVANFFMAKQIKINELKWDPALKLGEHQDFFLRAKKSNYSVYACGELVTVLHKQDHTNPEYKQKRGREIPYIRQFLKKHNLKNFYNHNGLKWVWLLE